MKFKSQQLVTKISVSDIVKSTHFYENVLGFSVDEKYTITTGENPYVQMNLDSSKKGAFTLGLYKDIDKPFNPMPETGTVPSFIVDDIKATLLYFQDKKVVIDKIDGQFIITNTSDKGFTDLFFFFRDPDNNSLVIRENLKKKTKD